MSSQAASARESFASCLYTGTVMHRRFKPRAHKLRYRVYWMLLDVDDVEAVSNRLKLFSCGRFNLFSFFASDYASGSGAPLRTQVERHLTEAGVDLDGGPIRLLTMPRVLGYAFNPISVYFCYRRAGPLAAILYEVNNTFGERHSYLIPVATPGASPVEQHCEKDFYVSPFLNMRMNYDFRVTDPGRTIAVTVHGSDQDGPIITASLAGEREPLTDGALLRTFLTHPLLTLKVVGAIHWEALKLWTKGVRLVDRPKAPEWPVTIVHPATHSAET
ncbi:MAG TPA: DUF1365 domain-containing protein [Xanthobacteraceae bacterium]|jgi:DUF1365 family protein|nr:DUF1365 domain-containing protein [Xanthobacteraceae bacterium]